MYSLNVETVLFSSNPHAAAQNIYGDKQESESSRERALRQTPAG